ncbi:hypothetical protein VNO80_25060 [Phaseolus coccineus]|uniref:Uncharacterized protein n=1 Tax=Phaseolus coccineus TaxID=3886 RepID=A0AAN9LTW4_PHACN
MALEQTSIPSGDVVRSLNLVAWSVTDGNVTSGDCGGTATCCVCPTVPIDNHNPFFCGCCSWVSSEFGGHWIVSGKRLNNINSSDVNNSNNVVRGTIESLAIMGIMFVVPFPIPSSQLTD